MKKGIMAIGFLLGAVGAGAILLATRPAPDDAVELRVQSSAGRVAAEPPAPADTAANQAPRWEAAILARPLFNPDRRPFEQAAPSAGDVALPRLSGIVITPEGRSAIFVPAGGGKLTVVEEGGSIGGYVLQTISFGEVVLTGPDGSHSLGLTWDRTRPVGGSAPPVVMGQGAGNAAPTAKTKP
jgi:hypothetical protein